MSFVDHVRREVHCKIAYIGPYAGGKTTNVIELGRLLDAKYCGKRISLATEAVETYPFEFLPVTLGLMHGYQFRLQLYAVAGKVVEDAASQLIVGGADGVVFVADSAAARAVDNKAVMDALVAVREQQGATARPVPVVLQYNKRDVADALPIQALEATLNPAGWPASSARAVRGEGVVATFKSITQRVLLSVRELHTPQ